VYGKSDRKLLWVFKQARNQTNGAVKWQLGQDCNWIGPQKRAVCRALQTINAPLCIKEHMHCVFITVRIQAMVHFPYPGRYGWKKVKEDCTWTNKFDGPFVTVSRVSVQMVARNKLFFIQSNHSHGKKELFILVIKQRFTTCGLHATITVFLCGPCVIFKYGTNQHDEK
jgi:hypothetical protein